MDLVARTVVAYAFVLFVMRVTGTRELSSMQPFDLVLLVVIGDLIQQGVAQSDVSVTGAMVIMSTLAALSVIVAWLNKRVHAVRGALEGEPVILIERGRLIDRNLRHERITRSEIAAQARQAQIARLEDVEWAVLETNGRISFIPSR